MNDEKLFITLMDKMLEKHGVDYRFIMENQKINGVDWFEYYTMTQEECDTFREFGVNLIRTKGRRTRRLAENTMSMWLLNYCLKIVKS